MAATLETLQQWQRLLALIQHRATGTPDQLAYRLGVSRSTLTRHIRQLNLLSETHNTLIIDMADKRIVYNHNAQTYIFADQRDN